MTYLRIDNLIATPIVKKEIILLNDLYFQLVPHNDGKLEMFNLGQASQPDKKKDSENSTKYTFEKNDKLLTIGRDPKCTVPFTNDKFFSNHSISSEKIK